MIKKTFVCLLIIIQIATFLSGCGRNTGYPISKTIVTNYGEMLEFEVSHTGNFHHEYLLYRIRKQNTQYIFCSLQFHAIDELPSDPTSLLEHIVCTEHINLYKLENSFIFSNEKFLNTFTEFTLKHYFEGYIERECESYTADEKEAFEYTFEKLLEAFVETKQIKYIHYCAPLLIEKKNDLFAFLIDRWATGDISEEEILINATDGYDKNAIVEWAKQFSIED